MASANRAQRCGPNAKLVTRNSALFAMKDFTLIDPDVEVAKRSKGVWMEHAVLLVAPFASQDISLGGQLVFCARQ